MDRVARTGRAALQLAVQKIRIHTGLLGEGRDDFPVVIAAAQFIGKALSQFASAAAELTAYGDDVSHVVSSVCLL